MKVFATLIVILLTITMKSVRAQTVDLDLTKVKVTKALDVIKKQTGYSYTALPGLLKKAKIISIKFKGPLTAALNIICEEQIFTGSIIAEKSLITFKFKEAAPKTVQPQKDFNVWVRIVNKSEEPVGNVMVIIPGRKDTVRSYTNGWVYLKDVRINTLLRFESNEIEPDSHRLNHKHDFKKNVTQKSSTNLQPVKVIYTGYQQQAEQTNPGSTETLTQEDLQQRTSPNIKERLEGLVVGLLQIPNKIPGLNQGRFFAIGARNTIHANPDPLIIVDNFPFQANLLSLNPDNIEEITVLRDAAAASIWGARAGNGVIVITTKSGKYNRHRSTSFNMSLSFASKPDLFYLDKMSSADRVFVDSTLTKMGYFKRLESNPTHPALPPVAEAYYNNTLTNELLNQWKTTDARQDAEKYFYRKRSIFQHYTVQYTGGCKDYAYFISVGYDRALPELRNSHEDKINLTANNSFKPLSGMEVTGGISYTRNVQRNTDNPSIIPFNYNRIADDWGNPLAQTYIRSKPFTDTAGVDPFGNKKLLDWKYYALTDFNLRNKEITDQVTRVQTGIKYKKFPGILNGLEIGVYGQYQLINNELNDQKDKNSFFVRDLVNSYTQVNGSQVYHPIPWGDILQKYITRTATFNIRYLLTYNKKWNNNLNSLTLMVGRDFIRSKETSSRNTIYNYSNANPTGQNNLDYTSYYPQYYFPGFTLKIPNDQQARTITDNSYSYYANGSFGWKDKYFLYASSRFDKSNIYGANTNDKYLPLFSIGSAYVLSAEPFFRSTWLDYLKFRITYGTAGNTPTISAIQTISQAGYNVYGSANAAINNPPLPTLRWEKVYTFNLGLNFRLINNVLEGTFDWYRKKSTDLIGFRNSDITYGITSYVGNVASMASRNVDVTLTSRNLNREIKWITKLQVSFIKDYVTHTEDTTQPAWMYCETTIPTTVRNKPMYSVFSLPSMGLDINGDPIGRNKNKDYASMITAKGTDSLIYHGRSTPAIFGSFTNDLSWKQLHLSVTLFYKFNYYFRKQSVFYQGIYDGTSGDSKDFEKRWQKAGDELHTNVPKMVTPANVNRDYFYMYSNVLVHRADHIRLQNIQLSYDLEGNFLKKLPLKTGSFYMNWSNVGIIWRANSLKIDPDRLTEYPQPAILTFGFRGSFR